MEDKNFEKKFNKLLNDNGRLFNSIGEDRARKIYDTLKKMKTFILKDEDEETSEVKDTKYFVSPTNIKTNEMESFDEKFNRENGEPDEVIRELIDGKEVIREVWRDEEGRISEMRVMVEGRSDGDDVESIVRGIMDKVNLESEGFARISSIRKETIKNGKVIKSENTSRNNDIKTLEDALDYMVSIEDYEGAAKMKSSIEAKDRVYKTFWTNLEELTQERNLEKITSLVGVMAETQRVNDRLLSKLNEYRNISE